MVEYQKCIVPHKWGDDANVSYWAFIIGGYDKSLSAYQRMFDTAEADFPGLDRSSVICTVATNSAYNNRAALIAFKVNVGERVGYRSVDRLEFEWSD